MGSSEPGDSLSSACVLLSFDFSHFLPPNNDEESASERLSGLKNLCCIYTLNVRYPAAQLPRPFSIRRFEFGSQVCRTIHCPPSSFRGGMEASVTHKSFSEVPEAKLRIRVSNYHSSSALQSELRINFNLNSAPLTFT
jgi:hypothetical protein